MLIAPVVLQESSLRDESGASSLPQKPSLVIEDLSLHSPSSIVGTPFDVSPRFEYPFPSDIPEPPPTVLPIHASLAIQFSAFPNTTTVASPTLTLSNPPPRESRGFLATHPKLQTREPPIPPGLSKKRWSLSMSAPGRPRLRTRSSGDSIPKAPPTTTRPGSLGLGKP